MPRSSGRSELHDAGLLPGAPRGSARAGVMPSISSSAAAKPVDIGAGVDLGDAVEGALAELREGGRERSRRRRCRVRAARELTSATVVPPGPKSTTNSLNPAPAKRSAPARPRSPPAARRRRHAAPGAPSPSSRMPCGPISDEVGRRDDPGERRAAAVKSVACRASRRTCVRSCPRRSRARPSRSVGTAASRCAEARRSARRRARREEAGRGAAAVHVHARAAGDRRTRCRPRSSRAGATTPSEMGSAPATSSAPLLVHLLGDRAQPRVDHPEVGWASRGREPAASASSAARTSRSRSPVSSWKGTSTRSTPRGSRDAI